MTLPSRTQLTFVAALGALALGCQAADEGDDHDLLAQDSISCDPSIDGGAVEPESDAGPDADGGAPDAAKPDPNAPYFASVTANGTGCPAHTWTSNISPDGSSFDIAFSRYEVEVAEGQRIAFKDCNLTIKLRGPEGISYALESPYFQGYAFLESGVKGFATANYYFQGNPVPSADKEQRTDLTGPVDRSFLFGGNRGSADLIWSPCGLDRNLQLVTRLGLQKTVNEGSGYINLPEIRGLKLRWKKC